MYYQDVISSKDIYYFGFNDEHIIMALIPKKNWNFFIKINKISCIFRIRLHVSCFILISFYFSYKIISGRNTIKIKKRFERLLIPYFIFPIIVSLINNFSFHYFNFSIFRRKINFHDLFIQFAVGRQFILVFWFQFFLIWTSLLFIIISFLFKKSS